MIQNLEAGGSIQFSLGLNDYAVVDNAIVIIDGVITTVAGAPMQFGPYADGQPSMRVIGSIGGGTCTIVDKAFSDQAVVRRDADGTIVGLIDPTTGAHIDFGGGTGGTPPQDSLTPSASKAPTVNAVLTGLNARIAATEKGAANGVATLGADSKLPTAQLPQIAIVDFLGLPASQAAMLALTGQKGDWCIRSDDGKAYVITGADPSVIGGWTALPYPGVLSNTDALPEGSTNLYYTAVRALATTLAGLSLADASDIAEADSIIAALGKLQAQINAGSAGVTTYAALTDAATVDLTTVNGPLAAALSALSGGSEETSLETIAWSGFGFVVPEGASGAGGQNPASGMKEISSFDSSSYSSGSAADGGDGSPYSMMRRRRVGAAAAAVNRQAGVKSTHAGLQLGSGGRQNSRFPVLTLGAIADANAADGSFYCGITSLDPTKVLEPSAHTFDNIWLCCDSADANLKLRWNDNAGAASEYDLGATDFPRDQFVMYGLLIDKNEAGTEVYATAINFNTGARSAMQTLTTNLPRSGTPMYPIVLRNSMATAFTASIDFGGFFVGKVPSGGGVSQAALDAVAAKIDPGVVGEAVGRALTQADDGKTLNYTGAAAANFTVPNTLTAPFSCEVVKGSTGSPTFASDGTSVVNVPTGKSATVANQHDGIAIQLMSVGPVTVRVI